MRGYAFFWALCLAVVALLGGTGVLTFKFAAVLVSLILVAAITGALATAFGDSIVASRQRRLVSGNDTFSTMWNGTVLAVSSICMSLLLDSALQNFGWTLPYSMVILCPISAVAIWLVASHGGAVNTLKLRMSAQKPLWRAALALVFFGLAVGVAAQVVLLAAGHIG